VWCVVCGVWCVQSGNEDDIDRKLKEKKAQLELIRKRNAEKAAAIKKGGQSISEAPTAAAAAKPAAGGSAPPARAGAAADEADDVLRSVSGVLSPGAKPPAGTPAHGHGHDSKAPAAAHGAARRGPLKLGLSPVNAIDIPAVERITYEMGPQTDPLSSADMSAAQKEGPLCTLRHLRTVCVVAHRFPARVLTVLVQKRQSWRKRRRAAVRTK
jgi:hypothetical protein